MEFAERCTDAPKLLRQADRVPVGSQPFFTPGPAVLEMAILRTIAYADLFDYPLTLPELHRYLVGLEVPVEAVAQRLGDSPLLRAHIQQVPPFWPMAGRAQVVDVRRQREHYSQALWPAARSYGRLIATMPFVRMVAVSGALAMDNASSSRDDIDLLIVARAGRVWLARALAIAVVHLARLRGVHLCPNYVLAETRLQMDEQDLYTAHELAQLLPLYGWDTYQQLWVSNPWVRTFLPNSTYRSPPGRAGPRKAWPGQRPLEFLLGGALGNMLERWESQRKIARLCAEAHEQGSRGAVFRLDLCKGHMQDHVAQTRQRYQERLRALGLAPHPIEGGPERGSLPAGAAG